MTPSVSLDDAPDKDERKLLIDFVYSTTTKRAAKEVWGKSEMPSSCLLKRHMEEQEKPVLLQRSICLDLA